MACAPEISSARSSNTTQRPHAAVCQQRKEIPDNWRQVSGVSGGVSLSSIVKDFINPLHDRLVSCARTAGQPIDVCNRRILFRRVGNG